eukprot:555933_1
MATETKQQIEIAMSGVEETKLQKENEITEQDNSLKCYCGELMQQKKPSEFSNELDCCGCLFSFSKEKDEYFYRCPKGLKAPHKNGYRLCTECSKHMNSTPVEDIFNTEKLYYVYNNNKINGPMRHNDIIKMYIKNQFKEDRLYIMCANGDDEWIKLEFTSHILTKLDKNDEKMSQRFNECAKINAEIKRKYPDLYKNLVENVFYNKLSKVIPPEDIPKE